jgi:hypothetical protein
MAASYVVFKRTANSKLQWFKTLSEHVLEIMSTILTLLHTHILEQISKDVLTNWAIPFNIHTPLCTRSIKFEPLRKKIKVPTQTPPQKLINFCLTPQKKRKDQRMPMHTTPQKRLFQTPSEILVHRGVCILNGMVHSSQYMYLIVLKICNKYICTFSTCFYLLFC